MAIRAYYSRGVGSFLQEDSQRILGILTAEHRHALEAPQLGAWLEEIEILKGSLGPLSRGELFLELHIPRIGKRADAALVLDGKLVVLEFKVGEEKHTPSAIEQVVDYCLDLKNFHEGSRSAWIIPVLVATRARSRRVDPLCFSADGVAEACLTNREDLAGIFEAIAVVDVPERIDVAQWSATGYRPTPTIIQAAQALYQSHKVDEIARHDAGAKNLERTTQSIWRIAEKAHADGGKALCFVTGVPGSGKTLAGLKLVTQEFDSVGSRGAAFLSGNGPLVDVLREALARDKKGRDGGSKSAAEREVGSFVQNVHHFRDEYLKGKDAPFERIVVFDEAQRAWTREQTANFMRRRRGIVNFGRSEPEFLIGVMDRHPDWCVVVCLVGGGQEINTGEAGISEWIGAIRGRFAHWKIFVSSHIADSEYGLLNQHASFLTSPNVTIDEDLHLGVSMRSFRAEALASFVGKLLENKAVEAAEIFRTVQRTYPVVLTRSLDTARRWLRERSRGSERFGLVASSGALRLKAEGLDVRTEINPAKWFLNGREDVRSSFSLEDAGTEFSVQGLELDWVGVCWDADLFYCDGAWNSQSFVGARWQAVHSVSRRLYLKNAYRVLLTRARQGMVLYVPNGSDEDKTRRRSFYHQTFDYLRSCGIPTLSDSS